jgi:hypothetical protein
MADPIESPMGWWCLMAPVAVWNWGNWQPCWKSQPPHPLFDKKTRIPAARKLLAIISQLLWKTPGNFTADDIGINPMLETWPGCFFGYCVFAYQDARARTHAYIFMYTHVLCVFWFSWYICLSLSIYIQYTHYTNRKSVWMYYALLILQIL